MKNNLLIVFLLTTCSMFAQEKKESKPAEDNDPPLSKTQARVTIGGKVIDYTATTGYMILRDESGKAKGKIFFVYYQKDNEPDPSRRPITFTFNGGPGSASVWLHMGGLGPRRIEMTEFGAPTMPPYRVIDNEYSWLDETDLVFIDPPYELIPELAPALFERLLAGLASNPSAIVVFEYPGELELAPAGWTLLKRLGKGARQPTVGFFRRAVAS